MLGALSGDDPAAMSFEACGVDVWGEIMVLQAYLS